MHVSQKETKLTNSEQDQATYRDVFIDPLISDASNGPMSRYNEFLKYFIICILVLSPIPFGSERPAFWALWGALIACCMTWYALMLARRNARPRVRLRDFPLVTGMFVLVLGFMFLQILPIGFILNPSSEAVGLFSVTSLTGAEIVRNSLSLTPADTWYSMLRWLSFGFFFFPDITSFGEKSKSPSDFQMHCSHRCLAGSFCNDVIDHIR